MIVLADSKLHDSVRYERVVIRQTDAVYEYTALQSPQTVQNINKTEFILIIN